MIQDLWKEDTHSPTPPHPPQSSWSVKKKKEREREGHFSRPDEANCYLVKSANYLYLHPSVWDVSLNTRYYPLCSIPFFSPHSFSPHCKSLNFKVLALLSGKQTPGNAARRDTQLGRQWNFKLYISFLCADTLIWSALTWDLPSQEADVDKKGWMT